MEDVLGGDGVFEDCCGAVAIDEDEGYEIGMMRCVWAELICGRASSSGGVV